MTERRQNSPLPSLLLPLTRTKSGKETVKCKADNHYERGTEGKLSAGKEKLLCTYLLVIIIKAIIYILLPTLRGVYYLQFADWETEAQRRAQGEV